MALYFEKYSLAPPPSRDYYALRVQNNEIKLFHWKISHGPHKTPLTESTDFSQWKTHKELQQTIEKIFGKYYLDRINSISSNSMTLLTLPDNLLKKLLTYLSLNDILSLKLLSRLANQIFTAELVNKKYLTHEKSANKMADDWRDLSKETREIEQQFGLLKNPKTHQRLISARESSVKASPRRQLEIARRMKLAGGDSASKTNLRAADELLITHSERQKTEFPFQDRADAWKIEKKLVNIVNLDIDNVNSKSPLKNTKKASPKTTSRAPGVLDKQKDLKPTVNVAKINSRPRTRPLGRKVDFPGDLEAVMSRDSDIGDWIKRINKKYPTSNFRESKFKPAYDQLMSSREENQDLSAELAKIKSSISKPNVLSSSRGTQVSSAIKTTRQSPLIKSNMNFPSKKEELTSKKFINLKKTI